MSLSVASLHELRPNLRRSPNLRNTALWHPQIPEPDLRFLGSMGPILEPDQDQELPICFVLFGGFNGEHVGSLSNITLRAQDDGEALLDITVDFIDLKRAAHLGSNSVQAARESSFIIDGSRGERIIGMDTFCDYDVLSGIKVSLYLLY